MTSQLKPHIQIRLFEAGDQEVLSTLFDLNSPNFFHPEERVDFLSYLEEEREDYFVLTEGGKIQGCGGLNYFPEQKKVRISWDIIHPLAQQKGYGTKLLQHRIEHVRQLKSFDEIEVRTSQIAWEFYLKNRFVLLERSANYWAPGFDLYLMKFRL